MKNRFNDLDFEQSPHWPDVAPGTLLIASPHQSSTPFDRSVVLVLQSSPEGTFGVMLNRPVSDKMKTAWQKLTGMSVGNRCFVQGGPISGPVFALHQQQSLAEMEMPGGVFVTVEVDKFHELIHDHDSTYRIVFGIAGWQAGSLTEEIDDGKWFTLPAMAEQVFDDPDQMWERLLREYGELQLSEMLGEVELPWDPTMN